ncbi:uncharacterized protein TRUGW13939_10161 [Talaromyces rugulosus]|uniref:PARP-type domain-containing protein n=1 Tax=Talaromyces rugulosus TaxID=121627 RepID=A0A7H8REN2_TALRU|nr:uncharacterized protein TRUGW13939_10161 [Talaromyces rugulosus]QKX62993.1 hypothetical protein TRUGW13939_10161 [Talaromyces rugulosus]
MGSYRVEVASSGRAGCNGPACKKNKVKILKGEIRLGVWVETEKYQSWSWRHWGCVTPKVISNIGDSIDENGSPNFDVLDGLDELPEESQDKIKRAVKEGEVPVEDRTVVADNETTAATEEPAKATKASKAKKRSRADGEEADETAPKKSGKSTGKAAAAEEEASKEKPTKATKASKTKKRARADSEEAAEVAPKKARKSTGKAAAAETENGAGSDDEEADEVPSKKPRKSTGKAVVEKETSEEKPARRGRSRKAVEEPVEKVAEPKKTAGRKRKASVTEEEGADNAEPEAKPAARKTRKSEATNGEKAKRGRPKRA